MKQALNLKTEGIEAFCEEFEKNITTRHEIRKKSIKDVIKNFEPKINTKLKLLSNNKKLIRSLIKFEKKSNK